MNDKTTWPIIVAESFRISEKLAARSAAEGSACDAVVAARRTLHAAEVAAADAHAVYMAARDATDAEVSALRAAATKEPR